MTEKGKLEYLKNQGIDAVLGMRYADDSLSFYEELIGIFLEEYEEKVSKVVEASKKGGREYTVLVHGLKNNAKALGAVELAGLAYEHEKASKSEDMEYIAHNLQFLLQTWEKSVQIFQKINS